MKKLKKEISFSFSLIKELSEDLNININKNKYKEILEIIKN